jgi:phosphopantetheine adenylyltransferase
MNLLVQEIIEGLLPEAEGKRKVVAVYGGGFKPPTEGHFAVIKKALEENPEIDEFIIFIGTKDRDGLTKADSLLIWEIYNKYLPYKVKIDPSDKSPIQAIYNYAKEHPEEEVLFVIGAREKNEEDFKDIALRTKSMNKYPNLELRTIVTKTGASGTAARNAAKVSFEKFRPFLPAELTDEEAQEVFDIVSQNIQEELKQLNENASYSQNIDLKKEIAKLTKHMIDKGMNILPLPKLVFKNGDSENAKQFLGKTAYYDPNSMSIVLYTEGRHPKDIVRSFSHEMVHHTQNLEGRLGDVSTTNTMEDDHLDKLEQEANLKGTMTFRNWTDSLNENLTKNSNQIYHWTSYSACKKIIESNKLKSNESNQFFEYDESRVLPDYKNVVFFTIEDERFADEENSNQCILVVDKSKLSKDYKVISYGDPYEETVVYTNDSSIPILPYLKGVVLMNTLQKSAVKKMVEFLESKGIPYEINDNLEKEVKDKQAKLPTLKKELINKLKLKYPNGFIGYLNTPLLPYQTPEYFKDNSTYSSPNITINKPGEYGGKNKFQIKFKIEPQNLEKYINWFMYSPDSIEDLIDMDNYEGEELWLKGDIPIDLTTLQEAIVGEKIECNNCGWKWNIEDGGDDLFICHKCGHDNTPLQEKKTKDPFGINAYAMELGRLREEEGKYKVYLDMDGVLADFDQRFRGLADMEPKEFEEKYGKNAFWNFIDEEHKIKFWVGIPIMPGAKELVDYVRPYDYEILSAPSMKKQSRLGKILWVKNHTADVFGSKPIINFKQAKEKHLVKPELSQFDILVDDRADTIDRWNAAGGTGILYTSAGQTINTLKKLGL